MDPLSLAASVVAVVQVTQSILLACYRIRNFLKDADDDIARIVTDVEELEITLEALREIIESANTKGSDLQSVRLDDNTSGDNGLASAACRTALQACQVTLGEILQTLQPLAKPGLKTMLKWPFESAVIQRKLEDIGKRKATLQLALSAYQMRMLGQQSLKLDNMQIQSERAAVLAWYKTSDPEQNHRVSRSRHEPDTSRWIFDAEEFTSWDRNPGESLWLHGIPGAGKTILCSTIIDHVSQVRAGDQGVKVTYFYFDFSDGDKQSVSDMLKAVIYQLIVDEDELPDSAATLHAKCHGLTEPGLDELLGVIFAEVSRSSRTFLLIDALDECPRHERTVFFSHILGHPLPENLSLLITSRKEHDIEAALLPAVTHSISIQSSKVDADVRIHVKKSIERDPRLSKWKPSIRDEILAAIVLRSNGMYVGYFRSISFSLPS